MADEIVNRVAASKLVTFDLEEYYPDGRRVLLDIKEWLYEDIILKEKDFRAHVANHDWERYKNTFVALYCSSDAIIPGWAYMLVTTALQPFAQQVVLGDLEVLETAVYQSIIDELDVSQYVDKPIIIKGCTSKPVPPNAYIWVTLKLQKVAKSVMYGEACSSVPLYKKK
jgi:hypothetical protein